MLVAFHCGERRKADGKDSQGIKVGNTEIYFAERYFTVTGNCIHSPGVINDSTKAVSILFEKVEKGKTEKGKEARINAGATAPTPTELCLPDEEVIRKAKKSRCSFIPNAAFKRSPQAIFEPGSMGS